MSDLSGEYLTTKELADLLRIKERKVYDLAASGEIPCTRAVGKLLFQRTAIDAWLARHESGHEDLPAAVPTVVLGSHDPLLDWALRESNSGIATFLDGSLDGLDRLARGEGIAAGLHVYDGESDNWNRPAVEARFSGKPVVLVEWAWRERGLIVEAGNPKSITSVKEIAGLRVVPRQAQAGSQVLLDHQLAEAGLTHDDLTLTHVARTETDAALAVAEGKADAAFGLPSVARQYQLEFVPVVKERFDLLVWRREWFEEPFQKLLAFTRTQAFAEKTAELEGYEISGLGNVHYNAT